MCGISGFNWADKDTVVKMTEALSYRGPDASGVYTDTAMSLGHNRLSIIDLSPEANQPMYDSSGRFVIVFNGEIYNFKELKAELAEHYRFKTESDTEVLLAGYIQWGDIIVSRLKGMFAFAIWDIQKERLFCARDHAGMKPFYYFWDGDKFMFASEISTLLVHDIPRQLNYSAFEQYMRILYVPEPHTLLNNIYKLPPAHTLVLEGKSLLVHAYSYKEDVTSPRTYTEATEQLRTKVIDAVQSHLVADVPVGVYLSGGIDSSIVLASLASQSKKLNAFSVGFSLGESEEKNKFNADMELAKKTADHFGVAHHTLYLSPEDALRGFEEMVLHNSDPISNPTALAMMRLAEYAKQSVSVVLTGNGGDELFGGYERYRIALIASYFNALPSYLQRACVLYKKSKKLVYTDPIDLYARFMFIKDPLLARVIKKDMYTSDISSKQLFSERYFNNQDDHIVDQYMHTDFVSWLPDYFLLLSDKMSMAHALEERMPLLDSALVSFAGVLPRSYKVDLFNTKKILKDAFRSDLPDFLFNQPKRGWFSPAAKWLRYPEWTVFAHAVLSKNYYKGTEGLFNWDEVSRMLDRHINKEEYNLTLLWALITFQTWARCYNIRV